jgi:hypothetical protein
MRRHKEAEARRCYHAIRDIGKEVVEAWGATPAKAARALRRRHPEVKIRDAFVTESYRGTPGEA